MAVRDKPPNNLRISEGNDHFGLAGFPVSRTDSENLGNFRGEIAIHSIGLKNLDAPIVWIFPEIVVCLNYGTAQFAVPEAEPRGVQRRDTSGGVMMT